MRIACQKLIARPPEAVFPWIAVPEKALKWQKNVRSGVVLVSTPEVVGTTFRETVEENGRSLEMRGEITHYAENRMIGFHLVSRIHAVDVAYSVEPAEGGTTVRVLADIRWRFPMNAVALFLGRKMQRELEAQMDSELLELARLCEQGAP